MTKNAFTYQENFKIRASEIDSNQKATLPAICNLLQEIAGNHAQKLHFDITDLQENKLTWVLHRLVVKMDRFPDWRETITVKTWPSSGDGLRAYRDFQILDAEENVIGKSLSYWLMMNIESRR
ncbi:MAG TPA: acyl-ACP thioesterase domain-containing protein, partial [Balneolaceae bacterium]|nr:acyl-ACP thioesterase domain-containing protein [Balneolaceae bacterium]